MTDDQFDALSDLHTGAHVAGRLTAERPVGASVGHRPPLFVYVVDGGVVTYCSNGRKRGSASHGRLQEIFPDGLPA